MINARLGLQWPNFGLDVSLSLPAHGVTALFGPSGCGKTTVLRALAGLERAAGRVDIDGEVWQDDAAGRFVPTHQRALGYVIQEAALFPHLDVARNLDYGRRRNGKDGQRVSLDQAVELLGIGHLMSRRPATLSGGERQRVAIARALACGPRLLLMDEPLAALDAARKAEVLPYLERLQRQLKLPIVYVSHAIDEVARLADHLVVMDKGRVLVAGPLTELLARNDLPLSRQDEAGVVIDGQVIEHDRRYGLTHVGFAGGALWVGQVEQPVGTPVRARVLARDISVTRQLPVQTSVLNVLPVVMDSGQVEQGTVLLRLRVRAHGAAPAGGIPVSDAPSAGTVLLARITLRSYDALALKPGEPLYAQVKGVALMQAPPGDRDGPTR